MKAFSKRILAVALALLCLGLPLMGLAQADQDMLVFGVRVVGRNEVAVKAPASGDLEPFTLRAGDRIAAGDTLFTVEPKNVYADIGGTIADVYATTGDIADAAVDRYGSVLAIERIDRYEVTASLSTGHKSEENRNPYVGTQVYLRNPSRRHFADGVITAVNGNKITVAVIGGDLLYTEDARIYLDAEYSEDGFVAKGSLSQVAPYAVTASGTITAMHVKKGDKVKAGDLLFSYVPDMLEPELRGQKNATVVQASQDLIVSEVSVAAGASVQKGQTLLIAYAAGDYQLAGQVEEKDLGRLQAGDKVQVTFEEAGLGSVEATVASISPLGSDEDPSRYTVYFDFEAPQGVLLGMHATVEK